MRANVRRFPGIRAARFPPMTSLAHPLREQNAARDAPHTRPRRNPRVPNPNNPRHHFIRPRGLLVSDVERFHAGSRRRARAGRARNAPWTSNEPSREPGAEAKLTPCGPPGSPLVSPVWTGPSSISSHALTHAMTLAFCTPSDTHFTTHSGTITSGIRVTTVTSNPGVSLTPQAPRVPVNPSMRTLFSLSRDLIG